MGAVIMGGCVCVSDGGFREMYGDDVFRERFQEKKCF